MNALVGDWFPESNRLVVVAAPEAAGLQMPGEGQLAAVVRAASEKQLEAYVDTGAGEALMDTPPPRGAVVKTTTHADAGITEWVLSNGATVVLKPTTLRADQVLFRATAPGGTSIASDADFIAARSADDVIGASGAGKFNAVALDKILSAKAVRVRPFINEIDEGMNGGSTPNDMELMFQLLYLRFAQPRADPAAFAAMRSQALALLANQSANPEVVFNQTIDTALNGGHPRRQPESAETVAQWNLDKSLAFYKARFADASNFTFVFVGSFTLDTIRPLVEIYIASLPSTRSHESFRDLGIHPPRGVIDRTIQKGIAPRSEVGIVFSGPFQYDEDNLLALRTMTLLLQSRLNDSIREELGGTYSITADWSAAKLPKPEYRVRIEWTCDPARTSSLVQRVMQEVQYVRDNLLTPDRMLRVRDILAKEFDRNGQENGYWLNQIARKYADGDAANVSAIMNVPQQIAGLTGYAVQFAGRRYLDLDNYVRVTLMPER
jgi:zinc protease